MVKIKKFVTPNFFFKVGYSEFRNNIIRASIIMGSWELPVGSPVVWYIVYKRGR